MPVHPDPDRRGCASAGVVDEQDGQVKRPPTLQDVAMRAGVGAGTVSRVLNHHPKVSDARRARVMQAMQDLNYTPNPHARRFAGGRSYSAGVLLPVVSTEFYLRLLTGLESTFQAANYDTALFPLLDRDRLERYVRHGTLASQADGLVMVTYNLAGLLELDQDRPVVLANASAPELDCAYVDNHLGGQLAAQHALSQSGDVYAIWVKADLDEQLPTRVFEDRRAGFHEALTQAGRAVRGETFTGFDSLAIYHTVCALLDQAVFPCTIFASADQIAAVLLDEAERRGVQVGKDLRVVGFDDHPWAAARGLTTVHQPVERMGAEAGRLLLSRLNGFDGPPRACRLVPRLVVRMTA